MVAVADAARAAGAVGGGAAVFQAEGLEAHLVVLGQNGLHLQAVVEGARHMEGHNAGGHRALKAKKTVTKYSKNTSPKKTLSDTVCFKSVIFAPFIALSRFQYKRSRAERQAKSKQTRFPHFC